MPDQPGSSFANIAGVCSAIMALLGTLHHLHANRTRTNTGMHTYKDAHYHSTSLGAEAAFCASRCAQATAATLLQPWVLCMYVMLSLAHPPAAALQVYLILDEFIMGGEMQETSKKVGLQAHAAGTVAVFYRTSALRPHASQCLPFYPLLLRPDVEMPRQDTNAAKQFYGSSMSCACKQGMLQQAQQAHKWLTGCCQRACADQALPACVLRHRSSWSGCTSWRRLTRSRGQGWGEARAA